VVIGVYAMRRIKVLPIIYCATLNLLCFCVADQ